MSADKDGHFVEGIEVAPSRLKALAVAHSKRSALLPQLQRLLLGQPQQPLFAILGDSHLEAFQGQNFGEQLGQLEIVVDQEYFVHSGHSVDFARQTDVRVRV